MPIQPWNKELYEAGLAVRKKVLGAQYVDPNIEKAENDPFTAKIQTMVTESAGAVRGPMTPWIIKPAA